MNEEKHNTGTITDWEKHCRDAVKNFIMNAVIIDNDPLIEEQTSGPKVAKKPVDYGLGNKLDDVQEQGSIPENKEIEKKEGEIDIRALINAFAEKEISCSFYFPTPEQENEEIITKVISTVSHMDFVIIDWYLKNKNPEITKSVLQKIAENDCKEGGRIRLICIYTYEKDTQGILDEAIRKLNEGGLDFNKCDGECLANHENGCLTVLNKVGTNYSELPDKLISYMSYLAEGLLPAFCFSAVAAIRKSMHHIISKFPRSLDGAFVANRLITNPPTDIPRLVMELFISECSIALDKNQIMDSCLGDVAIQNWLKENNQPKSKNIPINKSYVIDEGALINILQSGLHNSKIQIGSSELKFKINKRRCISESLHFGPHESENAEINFARFVTLKHEAFGSFKAPNEDWNPFLSLGTILRRESDNSYYYCLMPICDTVRLFDEKRKFIFLELLEDDNTNIIFSDMDTIKFLYADCKAYNITHFTFNGNSKSGYVEASKPSIAAQQLYHFTSVDNQVFVWIGEVRTNRALKDMAELNRSWLRLGIKDSEYLRLAGEDKDSKCFPAK